MTESIKDKITAIVLAGGESSRMGTDKALLPIGNNMLLSKICLIAKHCTTTVYVVTPWTRKYQDILPKECQLVQEELLLNARSNTPLIGFVQGLRQVRTEWILLLACDLPNLSSFQVKQWVQNLATVLPSEVALLPRSINGWEPLCGFYRRGTLPSLEAYIDSDGKSFQSWLKQQSIKELKISDRASIFNCNTPEDWQLVQQSLMLDTLKN